MKSTIRAVRMFFFVFLASFLAFVSGKAELRAGEAPGRMEDLGLQSVQGRPIEVYVFGSEQTTVMVLAGVHGDEPEGVELARALIADLVKHPQDLKCRVVVAPVINPDGLARRTRQNANYIDINRNFPTVDFGGTKGRYYSGLVPASEPETKAIMLLFEKYKPGLILSFHAPLGCINYDGPGSNIAARMSAADGLPVKASLGYSTPGSMGTFYGKERQVPVITMELRPRERQWDRHGPAVWLALQR